MSAFSISINSDCSTDANFRAWITVITNIMATAWVQTSDTGQINLLTVTHPLSIGNVQGYQIWRMNDSLQSTTPCYLKLEYGASTSSSATYPGIWVSVGTGTDGAGNLTGSNGIRIGLSSSAGNTGGTIKGSIDINRVCMYVFYGNVNTQMLICVERTHNTSGSDTSTGIMCFLNSYVSNTTSFSCIPSVVTTSQAAWNFAMPASLTSNAWGTNIYTFPIRTWGQGETSPSNHLFVHYPSDITALNLIPITTWEGTTRTFLPVGSPYAALGYGTTVAQQAFAIRYE